MNCQNLEKKTLNRWLRALGIAKILFEEEGYHIQYLQGIEDFLKALEDKT